MLVGDYLGDPAEFNQAVLRAYVHSMKFEGLGFDDALRLFMSSFRMPGEAQKIDRFMQAFASEYTVANPKSFKEADSAYVLAFSCIMLNTDAFNVAIKAEKKMKRETFIKINRDVDANLTARFLGTVYDRIVANEIVMRVDGKAMDSSDQNSIMCYTNPCKHGFLDKRAPSGILSGGSQKRWFVLKDSCLYYLVQPRTRRLRLKVLSQCKPDSKQCQAKS